METEQLYENAVALLRQMIQTPSFSKEEAGTAGLLAEFLQERGVEVHRKKNNVWAFNRHYNPAKPTILLNSHHDTVKPNGAYTRDPFAATIEGDRLYRARQQRRRGQRGIVVGSLFAFLRPERPEV